MSAMFYLLVADPSHPDDILIEVGKCSSPSTPVGT
jgi:hypothetical protein